VKWQKASELVYTSQALVRPGQLQLRLPVNLTTDHLAKYLPLTAAVSTAFYRATQMERIYIAQYSGPYLRGGVTGSPPPPEMLGRNFLQCKNIAHWHSMFALL